MANEIRKTKPMEKDLICENCGKIQTQTIKGKGKIKCKYCGKEDTYKTGQEGDVACDKFIEKFGLEKTKEILGIK